MSGLTVLTAIRDLYGYVFMCHVGLCLVFYFSVVFIVCVAYDFSFFLSFYYYLLNICNK